jgi:small subunit ribosomal protein S4
VSESDIVEVAPKSRELTPVRGGARRGGRAPSAGVARGDPDKMRILVHALPARAQIDTLVQEQLITEYYSK